MKTLPLLKSRVSGISFLSYLILSYYSVKAGVLLFICQITRFVNILYNQHKFQPGVIVAAFRSRPVLWADVTKLVNIQTFLKKNHLLRLTIFQISVNGKFEWNNETSFCILLGNRSLSKCFGTKFKSYC